MTAPTAPGISSLDGLPFDARLAQVAAFAYSLTSSDPACTEAMLHLRWAVGELERLQTEGDRLTAENDALTADLAVPGEGDQC